MTAARERLRAVRATMGAREWGRLTAMLAFVLAINVALGLFPQPVLSLAGM